MSDTRTMKCDHCGDTGHESQFAKVCPKCNVTFDTIQRASASATRSLADYTRLATAARALAMYAQHIYWCEAVQNGGESGVPCTCGADPAWDMLNEALPVSPRRESQMRRDRSESGELARAKAALEATGIAGIMDEFHDLPDAIQQMASHIADLTQQRDIAEGREPFNPIRPAGEIVNAEDF